VKHLSGVCDLGSNSAFEIAKFPTLNAGGSNLLRMATRVGIDYWRRSQLVLSPLLESSSEEDKGGAGLVCRSASNCNFEGLTRPRYNPAIPTLQAVN
jgi:hypothetical protein